MSEDTNPGGNGSAGDNGAPTGDGGTTGGAGGSGGGSVGDNDLVSMTQEALDALMADRAARAAKTATNDFLAKLGVKSLNDATDALGRLKTIEDGEKSELEKAQSDLEAAQTRIGELEEAVTTAEANFKTFVLRTSIVEAAREKDFLKEALDDVWLLVQNDETLSSMLKYDEEARSVTGADKVIERVAKVRPHWVQTAQPVRKGTPRKGGPTPPRRPGGNNQEEPVAPQVRF